VAPDAKVIEEDTMNTGTRTSDNTATRDVRQHGVRLAEGLTLRLQGNDLAINYEGDCVLHFIVKGGIEVEYHDTGYAPLLK
jgi:hypothetical protein